MKKKILIIGPFSKIGGRELEASFIASILKNECQVEILSTGNYFKNSDVKHLAPEIKYTGVNKLLYESNFLIRFFIRILTLIKKTNTPNHFRLGNKYLKKIFKIEEKRKKIIKNKIKDSDLIIIIAQLSSTYLDEIINYSNLKNKKIAFRSTGTIENCIMERVGLFKNVDLFIHHSIDNSNRFEKFYYPHNHIIIDQCSLIENDLLSVPIKKEKTKTFLVISRLAKEKRIEVVIDAFNKLETPNNNQLLICGKGDQEALLKNKAHDNKNIKFTGFIKQGQLKNIFKKVDCLIISSGRQETGPFTGIEAMAAGKLIISTKVGAMQERLGANCIWFDGTSNDLLLKLKDVSNFTILKKIELSKKVREIYLQNYSFEVIKKKYLKAFEKM